LKKQKLENLRSLLRSLGYFATLGLFGLLTSSLGPVLPDLSSQVLVSIDTVSIVFTARAFGFFFGSLLGGRLLDKYKSHPLFSVVFLVLSLATIYLPFSYSIWLLAGGVFIQGICLGFVVVGASTLIVWEHPDNPGPWLNTQGFINGMGGFFSPLIISVATTKTGSYAFSYWFYAAIACIFAAFFLFVRSPKIRKPDMEETKIETSNIKGLVFLMAVVFLLYVGAEVSFNGWIFTIATTSYSFSAVNARLLNSVFWGSMAIGRVIGIPLSKKVTADKMILISFTGSIISLLISIFIPHSSTLLWISTIGMGLFMATIFSSLLMYTENQMQLSGKKTSIFFSATSIGGMILPWISGQVFTLFSPQAVKSVVIGSLICGFGLFLYVKNTITLKKVLP
jgi:MFS transporter, FHS family, Na+ dependent glucose transporter 1